MKSQILKNKWLNLLVLNVSLWACKSDINLQKNDVKQQRELIGGDSSQKLPYVAPITTIKQELFLSPQGNDSNPGTQEKPLASLSKARDVVRNLKQDMSGDIVVYLMGGTYYLDEPFTLDHRDSGTNGFRVIYRNYPSQVPVISGGQQISNWEKVPGASGLFKASSQGLKFRQLYVNDKRAIRARYPNVGSWHTIPENQLFVDRLNRSIIVPRDSLARFANINANNGNVFWKDSRRPVEIVLQRHWRQVRARIESHAIDGANLILIPYAADRDILFNENTQNWRNPEGQFGGSFYFENSYFFVDQVGEWFLDITNAAVYFRSTEEESLDHYTFVVPHLDTLVSLNNAENIMFFGLTFQHSNWNAINETGLFHRQGGLFVEKSPNSDRYVANPIPGGIDLRYSRNIVFERNVFRHMGANGMNFDRGTKNNIVRGNVFSEISASAVNYASNYRPISNESGFNENDSFDNNYISNMGVDYSAGSGIFAYYSIGLKIAHNEMEKIPNIGINIGWGATQEEIVNYKENMVYYNKIYNVCTLATDCGAIHTKSNSRGSIIRHNWIFDVQLTPGWRTGPRDSITGIYLDDGSDNYTVRGNLVENVGDYLYDPTILRNDIPGIPIKHRFGNIGEKNQYINNTAYRVRPGQTLETLGTPINASTINAVKANAGLTPEYQNIKEYLNGLRPE